MTFQTDLAKLTYAPLTAEARGFLPPVIRAIGHLLFLTAVSAGTAEWETLITEEEALNELHHAKAHWDAIDHHQAVSTPTATYLTDFGAALASATTEFATWSREARATNLSALAHRAAALGATLDRELAGIRDSDPGHAL